ncbi:MAG TPA: DegT/DnrJ/EryC1/StrS family aminotransferase, partial [Candidatus Deferrimicrobium sp.]|nr:DegT/DnrJ/EryC1/StrS family aminotransferase [Candidatus Deferrimicrobium sp.]
MKLGMEIPAFPTVSPMRLLAPGGRKLKRWFPFAEKNGQLTFLGRTAIYHGLQTLDLARGSTVLVPAYHEGVEIDTLLASGYHLRYFRVSKNLGVDLADVTKRLDSSMSALYVIHYFGFPQPIDDIRAFCDRHGLKMIEDCALALFSRDRATWLGSVGDMAIFSVHKTLPVANLGFLLTRTATPLHHLRPVPVTTTFVQTVDVLRRSVRATPMAPVERAAMAMRRLLTRTTSLDVVQDVNPEEGQWASRMAEIGVSRWSRYMLHGTDPEKIISRRRRNYRHLATRLNDRLQLPFPSLPDGVCPLFLPLLVENKLEVQRRLAERGVMCVSF